MVVEIICVGTEILLGNIVNTNAQYLAEECAGLGLSMYHQTVVGDNAKRLQEALSTALRRSDIVILSGGLGPTEDDLTKETCGLELGISLVEDDHTKKRMEDYFLNSIYKKIPKNNWKQALVLKGSVILDNDNGTAPGMAVKKDGKTIILLPGPPNELIPMFENQVRPLLAKLQPEVIVSQMVKICGIGESQVETQILDLIEKQTNPTIAPYAKTGEVHLRITAKAEHEEAAENLIRPVTEELKKRFGDAIYSTIKDETLEMAIVKQLMQQQVTLATAESCTGGLLAGRITNVPGVSGVYKEGFITYSNQSKETLLCVKESTLAQYGAVSEETAKEMAIGGAKAAKTDCCIAVTGLAGPEEGTADKPVGLVYIACHLSGNTVVKELRLKGNRRKVREQAVVKALELLRKCLIQYR